MSISSTILEAAFVPQFVPQFVPGRSPEIASVEFNIRVAFGFDGLFRSTQDLLSLGHG